MNRQEAIAQLTAEGQPYELSTVDGPHGPLRVFANAPANLGRLYAAAVSDAPFLVYGDERYTFREAYDAAARIAQLLVEECGVEPGDRIAISMRNYPEWMLAFMAITSVGAIAVAMNSLWTPDEMAYGLTTCGVSVLFADAERLDRLAQCDTDPAMRVIAVRAPSAGAGVIQLDTALAQLAAADMPPAAVHPDDPAIILFTSGSTGHPKGVLSTHRNVISALLSWELDARQNLLRGAIRPASSPHPSAVLLGVPLFHVLGMHAVFLSSFRAQRKLVSMHKWDPVVAAELIERERITSFSGPPAMTGDLVREAQRSQRDLSSLQSVGGGGAARAPEQVRQIDASFRNAAPNTGWGMTETNAIGTTIGGDDYLTHPSSAGRCLAVLELRVVDDLGAPLPTNERGELQIRGTSMFCEYWNRPDATADSFTDDGWFRTGDVAYLDDEGYLYIVDRIKDLIIRGGENIGCGQVEAALLAHPAVYEAAVYAVPDERLGEEVAATLHGSPTLDLDELRRFLGEHLAAYEVPRYLFVTAEPLPRTGSGKLFKRQLRDEAVASLTPGG
jgi:long-chain acyl-CoA synthetase